MSETIQRRPRIYIAGPYTKPDPEANTRIAIEVWHKLFDQGFAPFCPHLTHFVYLQQQRDYEDYMQSDFIWLLQCEAVLRLPGESSGADREVTLAEENEIPVFTPGEWKRELLQHYFSCAGCDRFPRPEHISLCQSCTKDRYPHQCR